MDPTFAALITTVAVFTSVSVVLRSKRTSFRSAERHQAMAIERGLGGPEVKQLLHLTRMVQETTLADLLISPIRFDRAVARYVRKLRSGSNSPARYFGLVAELTRLRRKVHPAGASLRFLHSTRELPEGEQTRGHVVGTDEEFEATVWAVNEDHFELRPSDPSLVERLKPDERLRLELTRPGQGRFRLEARIRGVEDNPSPRIRLEHTEDIVLANRREFLRERRTTPIHVTPQGCREPVEASLIDIGGGGLAFIAARSLQQNPGEPTHAEVFLTLDDDTTPPLRLPAIILRVEQEPLLDKSNPSQMAADQTSPEPTGKAATPRNPRPRRQPYLHSCRWDDVDGETRELIIRFVFGLQRRRIRAAKALRTS